MTLILAFATFLLRFFVGIFAASLFFTILIATFKAFQK